MAIVDPYWNQLLHSPEGKGLRIHNVEHGVMKRKEESFLKSGVKERSYYREGPGHFTIDTLAYQDTGDDMEWITGDPDVLIAFRELGRMKTPKNYCNKGGYRNFWHRNWHRNWKGFKNVHDVKKKSEDPVVLLKESLKRTRDQLAKYGCKTKRTA